MGDAEFAAFRDEIESLARLARSQLGEGHLGKLRFVIEEHRTQGEKLESYYMLASDALEPPPLALARRLVAQLESADAELPPEQVAGLQRLLLDGLHSGD
jgi:hypothetical protein